MLSSELSNSASRISSQHRRELPWKVVSCGDWLAASSSMQSMESASHFHDAPIGELATRAVGENQETQGHTNAKSRPIRKARLIPTFASILFFAASESFATVYPSDGTEAGHNYPGG